MTKAEAAAIDEALRLAVEEIAPDARYTAKYGGEVIQPDPESDRFVAGIYVYANHVSLEFSHGAGFDDPNGLLEGGGKHRRHLKFRRREEVGAKDAAGFLKQALRT